jgi:hypothetical protein
MGLIVTIADGSKLYYSTNGQNVTTTKLPKPTKVLDPTSPIPPVPQEWEYSVQGDFIGWNDEESYNNKNIQNSITRTSISAVSNTLPTNNYTLLYTQFKNTLATTNYVDNN